MAAVGLYGSLMTEALARIDAIDHSTLNKTGLASPFVQEFCYLQLRKLCELFATACLVAHGEIEETASIHKEWNADKIIKRLSALDPNFFPYLVELDLSPVNGPKGIIGKPTGMTKEEMLRIYYECDNHLHVGSLKKLLKQNTPFRISYPDITAKAQKFRTITGSHTVFIAGSQRAIICYLVLQDGQPKVEVAIANRMSDGPPKLVR